MYDWEHEDWRQTYFEALDVMEIRGRLLDGNSWTLIRLDSTRPTASADDRTRGLLDCTEAARVSCTAGAGHTRFFHAPAGRRGFEVTMRSIAPMPQNVTFVASGRVLDTRDAARPVMGHA